MHYRLFVDAFHRWRRNRPVLMAAGLSYFILLSLIPSMVISLKLAGQVFEQLTAKQKLLEEVSNWFTPDVATSVQTLLAAAEKTSAKATAFSIGFLLWSVTRMFMQMQTALDMLWEVPVPKGVIDWLARRTRAVLMIAVFSAIVFIFLSLDLSFAILKKMLTKFIPIVLLKGVIPITGFVLSFALFTALFAMIFKLLPGVRIAWKNVWVGAMVSALLFGLARSLITFYLTHSMIASLYGAAGSVVALLIWIYFSTQIFLYGAAFTRAYSDAVSPRRRLRTDDV